MSEAVRLEICCGSLDDALSAQEGGADRVELCAALCVGGLTPSLGTLLEVKARLAIPVMVMIRPRAAGFHYHEREIAVMERDVTAALETGAEGVVFGVLGADGSVDEPACRRLRDAARDREAVFHRAFDVTPDPFRTLEHLVDLGFTRVLTSGGGRSALEGASTVRRLVDQSARAYRDPPGRGHPRPQRAGRVGGDRLPPGSPERIRCPSRSLDGGAARDRLPHPAPAARPLRADGSVEWFARSPASCSRLPSRPTLRARPRAACPRTGPSSGRRPGSSR